MKEILIHNGWKRNGGCTCNGGATFYTNDNFAYYQIKDFYRANFITLCYKFKQIRKGTYAEIESIIQQVESSNKR